MRAVNCVSSSEVTRGIYLSVQECFGDCFSKELVINFHVIQVFPVERYRVSISAGPFS